MNFRKWFESEYTGLGYNPEPIGVKQILDLMKQGWVLFHTLEFGGIATLYSSTLSKQSVRLNIPNSLSKQELIIPSEDAKEFIRKNTKWAINNYTVYVINPVPPTKKKKPKFAS